MSAGFNVRHLADQKLSGHAFSAKGANFGEHFSTGGGSVNFGSHDATFNGITETTVMANDSVNFHVAVELPYENAQFETAAGVLNFIYNGHQKMTLDHFPVAQPRGLPMCNYNFMQPAYRQKFGNDYFDTRIMDEWKYYGVSQHDVVMRNDEPDTRMTQHIYRRARVYNIWRAKNKSVQRGDSLWLVPRRLRLKDHADAMIRQAARGGSLSANMPDSNEWFWQIDPIATRTKEGPPLESYMTNDYCSRPFHIGFVTGLINTINRDAAGAKALAEKALYPTAADGEYLKALHQLDELEVMLRTA